MARGFNYAPGASEDAARAAEPGLAREVILELSGSKNAVVREIVAQRDDLTLAMSVTLAHDSTTDVRAALASNTHVSSTILEHLSGDRQRDVVLAVARNGCAPQGVLEQLALHKRSEVRDAALATLEQQAEVPPAPADPAEAEPAPSHLTSLPARAERDEVSENVPLPFTSNG
ncbi:hypothetical protein [Demequina zhanjiangensis]|uniref:Leucine rich repeat variant n=1 Tax=Demequina zhanjiangensis TaxID=3051659 RepID=A0ABT8FYL2_9MICO|nr:hypothetical protein [Demequina sp. SYSU T00b26]MDN4471529.1 hypothetical protein [Demequina sp. SYSU T00b26]